MKLRVQYDLRTDITRKLFGHSVAEKHQQNTTSFQESTLRGGR